MMDGVSLAPRVLSFALLDEITNGFSNDMKVGAGSYGNVYKGQHTNGEMIAVKVLHYIPGVDDEQFKKEYHNLASLQHKNIVRLVGYCREICGEFKPYGGIDIFVDTIKRALCFEYMQNGSLDRYISDESTGHDWSTRYAIIKGICQGLKYLHEELVPPMWHLDLKPGNVLLDENMMPKIADFGLSRLFGGEQTQMTKSAIGTHGYVPPEYIDAAVISVKFDIYSLGVMIIKIMTGPKGYFRSAEMSAQQFIELVHGEWKNKLQTTTSDYSLGPYCEQVKRCVEIALSCVDADRNKRPSMGVIIDKLTETETTIQLLSASMRDIEGSSTYKANDFPSNQGKKEHTGSGTSLQAIKKKKNVVLEITGGDYNLHRPGLDLVAVVDVSGSMDGEKINQLKIAIRFVLWKLGPIDRLSVVTFSTYAFRIYPLRPISKDSQKEWEVLIDDLMPEGGTNIQDGLLAGLKILYDRKIKNGRVAAIMLMSDGVETQGNAAGVDIRGNVPVYTFGFGSFSDPVVLSAVAANSNGGTFSHVPDIGGGGLTMAFSQCLAGLLTVSVQDLMVTLAPVADESAIVKVTAGSYPQTKHQNGLVTVSFGNVYSREVRRIIVDLLLPSAIKSQDMAEILKVTYSSSSSSYSGKLQFGPVPPAASSGIGMHFLEEETLPAEEARVHMEKMIQEAMILADMGKLNDAQHKLVEAQNLLPDQSNPMLQKLFKLFKNPVTYKQYGHSYALSMKSSHQQQRFAYRGMDIRQFATPRMDKYLEQVNKFLMNPMTDILPSVDDDVMGEVHADLVRIASREVERLSEED